MSERIYGKNSIIEAIRNKRELTDVLVTSNNNDIISMLNKNNIKYLSYVQGYRDKNGISRQKTIKKIGDWEELIKLYDNPIEHFNKIAKDEEKKLNDELLLKLSETIDEENNIKNLGYIALKKIYNELDLNTFFKNKQSKLNIEYNLNDIFELLTYSRIMYPGSKKETYENKNIFFENFDFSLKDVSFIRLFQFL